MKIGFARPYVNAIINNKKYLFVSVDHFSNGPEARILRKQTTDKVIAF